MNILTVFDPGARLVIGHRGSAARFPENTFASFDNAVSLGVDAIEFDLRITRDGAVVVMHDPTLDRTTDMSGRVVSLTAAEIAAADAGARFSPDGRTFPFAGKGISVPTLDALLQRYPSLPLLIELKVPEAAAETLRVLRRHGAESRVVVDSIDAEALRLFRDTTVATGAAKEDVLSLMWRGVTGLVPKSLPYAAVCVPERHKWVPVPVPRLVRSAGRRGVPTHVWTVNDPTDARRLWNDGVIGVITDDPEAMLALRRALRPSAI